MNEQLPFSPDTIDLVKHFEGFRGETYLDVGGLPTIGYGHLIQSGEDFSDGITEEAASDLCLKELLEIWQGISGYISVDLTPYQAGAITSLAYNLGVHKLCDKTIIDRINVSDFDGAANEFPKWRLVSGKVVDGLVRRRKAEKLMFEGKDWRQYDE